MTSRRDPLGRRTVYDCLPAGLPRVEAVGRLDRATTGLLLFSDDFRTAQRLLNPETELPRTYRVVTDRPLPRHARALLAQGLLLADGELLAPARLLPASAPVPGRTYLLTLHEGKNREIRRLAEHFGCRVRSLHRISFGPIRLLDLKLGETRLLREEEIAGLLRMASRGRNRARSEILKAAAGD